MLHPQDSDLTRTYCFSVRAAAEPSVLPRLIGLFAKRGLVPDALHARRHDLAAGPLQIDIEVSALDWRLADYLQRCMRQVVGVDRVLLSKKHTLSTTRAGSAA